MEPMVSDVRKVVANKAITILGKSYKPNDFVDVSKLPDHKVAQFLNQRILKPAISG